MKTKITKDDLKQDQIQSELQKGFKWTANHLKTVLTLVVVFVVAGAAFSGWNIYQGQQEVKGQAQFYSLEKSLLDAKKKLSEEQAKDKTLKGDFEKDFAAVAVEMKTFAQENAGKKAGRMAAVLLVDLYREYQKSDLALELLASIEKDLDKNEILSGLLNLQWGSVLADNNQCEPAVTRWETVINQKNLSFTHGETKLRMALCYQSLGQFEKAETLLSEVSKNQETETDFAAAQDAEKYLKFIRAQKNLLGSDT